MMSRKIHVNLEQRQSATMTAGYNRSSPVLPEDRAWRILHLLEPSGTVMVQIRSLLEQLINSEGPYEK